MTRNRGRAIQRAKLIALSVGLVSGGVLTYLGWSVDEPIMGGGGAVLLLACGGMLRSALRQIAEWRGVEEAVGKLEAEEGEQ